MKRHDRFPEGAPQRLTAYMLAVPLMLFTFGLWPLQSKALGACPALCGDVDGSGTVTSTDIITLIQYLYEQGPPPTFADCADIDDYELTTVRDLLWLIDLVFKGGAAPDCVLGFPPIDPAPSPNFTILHDSAYPPGVESFYIKLTLKNTDTVRGLTLPLAIQVGDQDATVVGITGTPVPGASAIQEWVSPPSNKIFVGFYASGAGVPPGQHVVGNFAISVPPAAIPRSIHVRPFAMSPLQAGVPVHYRMLVDADLDAWKVPLCPKVVPGDVDGSTDVAAGDVIQMVNFIFKGLPFPPDIVAGDVNCSDSYTSADIIILVNYIFKSGSLCDFCS